jgi:hypothetical protein
MHERLLTRLRLHSPIEPKTPDPREYINFLRSNPPNFGELAQTGIFVNKIREVAGVALIPFYKTLFNCVHPKFKA